MAGPARRPSTMLVLALCLVAVSLGCGDAGGDSQPPGNGEGPPPPTEDPSITDGGRGAPAGDPAPTGPGVPSSWAYTCADGLRFTVHYREGEAQVDLPSQGLTLPASAGDGDPTYSTSAATLAVEGSEASLELGDALHDACAGQQAMSPEDAARLLGYDFRGLGQEPGWLVDIDTDRQVRWVGDYGEVRFATGPPRAEEEGRDIVWSADTEGHSIRVTVVEEPCNDSMSGRPFSHTVRVEVDGSSYSGCGRWLDGEG